MPNDPFIDVGDLPSVGPVRYLDVRDQAAFDAGHAPGAVRVPLDEWDAAAKAADTGFAKTAYWDDALSALGVDPAVTGVAYDGGGMTNAARVWFILQYYGLKAVILNGGWPVLASATGCRRQPRLLPAASGRCRGQGQSGWSTGRLCGISSTVVRMCSIRGRARSSPARTRAIVPAAAIFPGHGTCRTRTCSRMAWFGRLRLYARCWSGSGL